MLLEFGLKNFFSFKEAVKISFRLDANCPPSISNGLSFTTVLGLKGANGAGKTNVLRGLSFLSHFCTRSFSQSPETMIPLSPFFESQGASDFYVEFETNGVNYLYELSATRKGVQRETIYQTKAKQTKILERENSEVTHCRKSLSRLKTISLRPNASIISIAHQYGLQELSTIHSFFNNMLSNVTFSGLGQPPQDLDSISGMLKNNADTFEFVRDFIKTCDVGISDIRITERRSDSSESKEESKSYFPIFMHSVSDKEFMVTAITESSGTKTLYGMLGMYKIILDIGGVLVLDEFDINLHPHILPKLLNLFIDPDINTKHAQIIFSTHNSEILNHLGRYRTYLVNKDANEAFAYRLDEIPGDILRNDRPILPAYNEGKIGGIPRI